MPGLTGISSPFTYTSTSRYSKPPLSNYATCGKVNSDRSSCIGRTSSSSSSYDLIPSRSYGSFRTSTNTSFNLGRDNYYSSSLGSGSSSSYSSYSSNHSSSGSNYPGLSSSPCTLTKFNYRRSSLDYNDSDSDSLLSIGSTSSSYLYSPLPQRRKYYLKSDEISSSSDLPSSANLSPGLVNLGNTCYMNSVLQALFASDSLKKFISSCSSNHRSPLISSLGRLFEELNSSKCSSISPNSFRSGFLTYQPKFRGYEQQDAQEFLRYLINGLHDEVNEAKYRSRRKFSGDSKSPSDAWERYKNIDDSPLIDLLAGQLSSVVTCTECRNTSTCWDPFWDISLPLPRYTKSADIQRCLKEFTSLEDLSPGEHVICGCCKKQTKSTKQLGFARTPEALILHLKRFSNDGFKLSYPNILPNEKLFINSRCYSLYGVVSHHGNSSRSGHYTAHCLHGSRWLHFNDELVKEVKGFAATQIGDAYILFYSLTDGAYSSRL